MLETRYDNRDEWLEARKCKITGSRLKDIVVKRGTEKKLGFYELIAERIAIPEEPEDAMERGSRLEEVAIARFVAETGKKVNTDLVIWMRDDNPNIALSPDGYIGKTEAVEVKCLSSARHLETYFSRSETTTHLIPDEYYFQVVQYFIVNEKLKTLYFVMYDPRLPAKDFFYLTIPREYVQEDVEKYLAYQQEVLKEVEQMVLDITF